MAKVSIQINSQKAGSTGTKVTDKISYVNPEATNEQLKQFAQKVSSLSQNSYLSTTKITEEVI